MFRTKKDVERHVLDVLSKIDNNNEKYLKGYAFARLFFHVKDYESAKKYLTGFLSVRDHHAPSHKLMAQTYEATNNPESALQSYKRSLEIDPHQNDIVLKICELYCKLPVDHETARYWADRAEQLYPHNEIVFKLREYLVSAEGEPDRQELENLIATELAAQPKNIDLRIKLLKLYLDSERVAEAYEHAILIESKRMFAYSLDWYYLLGDIFEQYQDECEELDSQYYINYLSALDHLIFLTLAEPHILSAESVKKSPSLNDTAAVLLTFDQLLKKAVERDAREGSWSYFLQHMKGQLYFHITSLLMKRIKMDQGNRKEGLRFASGLALVTYTFKPVNLLQEVWFTQMEDNQKIFTNFFQRASLRISFIGHVLLSFCKSDKSSWLQKIKTEVCIPQVKERIYNRIASSLFKKEKLLTSYFISDSTFEQCSLELPTEVVLKEYDKSAFKLCPDSLHHLVWLELHGENTSNPYHENIAEIFSNLQYNNKNLSKGSCESLCVLDLEAYLYATVFQAKVLSEKRNSIGNTKSDSTISYPPDIADSLCTKIQATWWKAAHGLSASTIKDKLGEHRRCLQQGLEVIRGIGNHGMDVQLVIHLAHTFASKAETLEKRAEKKTDKNKNKLLTNNVASLYSRSAHYWNVALGMLEKLSSGNSLNVSKDPMFALSDRPLTKDSIKAHQEAGKLFIAVRLMDADKLNEAAELLSKLSSPYASFYLAQTLMKLASQEQRYSSSRIALLNKAKTAIHDTMDRIKDDKTHELNKELFIVLEDVENELGHESANVQESSFEDADETDTYDGTHILNNSCSWRENSTSAFFTPRPSKFMPSQRSSSKFSSENHVQHFEPSPERLDAQVRALALNQDSLMKSILSHQENLLETINTGNNAIVEALKQNTQVVEQLKKQMEELNLASHKYQPKPTSKKHSYLQKAHGDEEEEYYDPHAILDYFEEGTEDYRAAAAYGFERSSRLVHEAPPGAAAPINYVVPPALPHGASPALSHYNYQYPPHVLPTPPPPTAVAERPSYYHPPGQGLPFSEGQQLPQFHFHVASSVIKPPQPLTTSLPPVVSALPPGSVPPPPPIVMPPTAVTLPPQAPWSKPVNVPHSFQIPLPASTVLVSAASTVTPTTTTAVAASVPVAATSQSQLKDLLSTPPSSKSLTFGLPSAPTATTSSPIFTGFGPSPVTTPKEKSRCDSENATSPDIDLEREVMGDFKPLIPLPAEVEVETGEENETVLFENRAKLYRFVDQEWKERGIGFVKILYDEVSGKVRLLMRRDQVLKVCANHYITSHMEIQPMKNSDRAFIWCAQDFADEKLQTEKFCIRFKTPETALCFKDAFSKAIDISKEIEISNMSSPKLNNSLTNSSAISKPFEGKFAPKAGSWTCPTCYVSNAADILSCLACETSKPGHQVSANSSLNSTNNSLFQTPPTASSTFKFGNPSPTFTTVPSAEISSSPTITAKSLLGGFTFSSSPVIKETETPDLKEREILVVSTKSKDGPQVTKIETSKASPFTGFSFNKSLTITTLSANSSPFSALASSTSQSSSTPSNFSISNIQSTMETISPTFVFTKNAINDAKSSTDSFNTHDPLFINVSSEGRRVSTESAHTAPEEFEPNVEFKPVVPLPALVDAKTGEEGEEKLFSERAKLFRFDSETKEWKERGVGEIKILHIKETNKYRILMRRDQVLKLCANHYILPEMELAPLNNMDKAWIWVAQDYSDGDMSQVKLAVKFKNASIAQQFFETFEKCKKELLGNGKVSNVSENICAGNKNTFEKLIETTVQNSSDKTSSFEPVDAKNQKEQVQENGTASHSDKPLSELFKPQTGSWECSFCYVRNNDADSSKCVSCESLKPGSTTSTADQTQFKFGTPNVSSTTPPSSELFNPATSVSSTTSLSELFKPPTGSWECQSCYVRNNADAYKCLSCETPKPGSISTSTSEAGSVKFKFGTSTSTSSASNSTFGKGSEFVFGVKPTTQPTTFTFGQSAVSKTSNESIILKPSLFGDFDQKAKNLASIFGGTGSLKTDSSTTSFFGGTSAFKDSSATSIFGTGSLKADSNTSIFGTGTLKTDSNTSFFGSGALKTDSNTSFFGASNQKSDFSSIFGGTPGKSLTNNASVFPSTEKPNSILSTKPEAAPSAPTPVFNFGANASTKDDSLDEFHFGSPQKYEFNFSGVRPRSPTKTPKSPRSPEAPSDVEDEEEESFDADNIYFTPVIPLPPKVDVKTGEENENTLFCKRAKLFRFCSGDKKEMEWKERGIGDFKILHDEVNNRIRLLMRRDQVLKVCLNHYLTPDIVFERRNEKTLSWAVKDFSENEPSDEIFALRFKTAEFANEFKSAIDSALELIGQPGTTANKATDDDKKVPTAVTKSASDVSKAAAAFSFKTDKDPKPVQSSFSAGSLSSRFGTSKPAYRTPSDTYTVDDTCDLSFGDSEQSSTSSFFLSHNTSSNFKFGQASETQASQDENDVEVVYEWAEAELTPEEKELTEKLQLPRGFYRYKSNPPCLGCIGCEDYVPPTKDVTEAQEPQKSESAKPESGEPEPNSSEESNQILFLNTAQNSIGFSDLSKNAGFASGSTSKKGFEGAGTPLFAKLNKTEGDGDDDDVTQGPDVHFEPVIPLPELVEVKTGEEDETPIFVFRAKLFKFDVEKKEWKERGIGDLKILQHKEKLRFRILLRREQVHKVACNHVIEPQMELSPLSTSATALCWTAMDFSDGKGEITQFAVRFKNVEMLQQFQQKFEQCKEILKQSPPQVTAAADSTSTSQKAEKEVATKPESSDSTTESSAESQYEQEHSDSDSNEDEEGSYDEILFEKRCTLEIAEINENYKTAGMGTLKIMYDDSCFGYRLFVINDADDYLCEHIIAIQNCLNIEKKKVGLWAAIDLSVDPPRRRKFRATFSSPAAAKEFKDMFEEGKESAEQSEIVENTEYTYSPTGQQAYSSP